MRIVLGLQELIFPQVCVGCGKAAKEVCVRCRNELKFGDYLSYQAHVPIFSSMKYSANGSRVLLSAKEDGIRTADALLISAIRHSLNRAIESLNVRPPLVPIPHSQKAIRMRGRDFLGAISSQVARIESLPLRQIIRINRKVEDQSGLDPQSRFGNLFGAMEVVRGCGRPSEVILVDDLVTTGSTLGEAVRALESANFAVIAAVTAFVAQPLR